MCSVSCLSFSSENLRFALMSRCPTELLSCPIARAARSLWAPLQSLFVISCVLAYRVCLSGTKQEASLFTDSCPGFAVNSPCVLPLARKRGMQPDQSEFHAPVQSYYGGTGPQDMSYPEGPRECFFFVGPRLSCCAFLPRLFAFCRRLAQRQQQS